MNEQIPNQVNPEDEKIAQALSQAAEQTRATAQFTAELEEKLRDAHNRQARPVVAMFKQISPALRWTALMIVLAVALTWSIKTLIPRSQPASNDTPVAPAAATPTPAPAVLPDANSTPTTNQDGYDWRGTKLYLSAPLPQTPLDAKLYVLTDEQPITIDRARALATQYGLQGDVYELPESLPGAKSFLVTDGKQRLYAQSELSYDYYLDYAAFNVMSGSEAITIEQASVAIDTFMKSHGMDIPYVVESANLNPGMFYVLPLTPDGFKVHYDYNMPARLEFTLDEDNQVIRVSSYQSWFEAVEGMFGIRSAEEAFQQVLNQSQTIQNGVLEIMRSTGTSEPGFWSRTYPDHQTLTLYGTPAAYPAAEPGGSPYIAIGQFTASGNISGIESVDSSTYIEAVGQFITENDVRKFNVDSWKIAGVSESYVSGSLRREGDQVILTADDNSGEYVLVDAPSDLPLNTIPPDEYLAVSGVIINGAFEWNNIQYFPAGSGSGGGGGAGNGFYKLNLSGTPVPFPTPTAVPQINPGTVNYVVKEGDTCASIGDQFGVSIQSLINENQLSVDCLIQVGQALIIPGTAIQPAEPTYTVQENDTLASIALKFGISVDELKQANDIVDNTVYLDQKLFIPGQQTGNPMVGRRFDQQRGTLIIVVHRKEDGTSWNEFGFYTKEVDGSRLFILLEDVSYEALLPYHNRPLDVWGSVKYVNQNGTPILSVERYEAPYPDLQFQVLRGTQKVAELEGERLALLTTPDGTTYAQLMAISLPDITMPGPEGSEVLLEVLVVPGETFGGYPAVHVFSAAMAVDPNDGQPNEMIIEADRPLILDEQGTPEMNYVSPELTIEKVELVYYVPDPRSLIQASTPGPHYIQPAWRFYGHYSDGSEVEFLVQALSPEFLLPELAPHRTPG